MNHRFLIVIFLFLLALSFLIESGGSEAVYSLRENFTVPTKTPVVPTAEPTSGGGGGGSNPTAIPPTVTPRGATAVPTAVLIAPTPVGGFLPTAEPCDTDPTAFALAATNVRQGPGPAYGIIDALVYLEVRPIVGRSGSLPFWQISLSDGRSGWVDATVVTTQGNTSVIPVVPAPPLNGATVTPGPRWNPPLEPGCDILPTRTPTPEQTETPSPTATTTSQQLPTPDNSAGNSGSNAGISETPGAVVQLETTALVPPTAVSLSTVPPEAEPLLFTQPTISSTDIFLIGVGVMVLLGGGVLLLRMLQK